MPYKGGGPAVTDLVAGHVGLMFASPIEVSQYVAAGQLKYIATATSKRVQALPDVPTIAELGYPNFEILAWFGIVAPAATPKDIVARLGREIGAILQDAELRERFAAQGAEISYLGPDELNRFLAQDRERWAVAIKASGARSTDRFVR